MEPSSVEIWIELAADGTFFGAYRVLGDGFVEQGRTARTYDNEGDARSSAQAAARLAWDTRPRR
jgi:hypothetical protein